MYSEQAKVPLVLTIIAGVVGACMITFFEFGGWYDYGYYVEQWGSVGFWNAPGLYSFFFLVGIGAFLFCAGVAVLALNDSEKVAEYNLLLWGRAAAIGVGALVFFGAVVFIGEMTAAEYDDWWFGPAFYGGLVCAGVSAICLFLVKPYPSQRYPRPHPSQRYPPPHPSQQYAQAPPSPVGTGPAQFCTECGAKLAANAKFCVTCGSKTE